MIPKGICHVTRCVPALLEDASNELPLAFRQLIDRLTSHLKDLDQQVRELERQIIAWHRGSELSRKLEKIPGIGPLAATALVATIADARSFNNGRQVWAWLGLVPRQNSSGGKSTLLGISKRGDVYLRTLRDPRGSLGHLGGKTPEWEQECLAGQPAQPATSEHRRRGVGQ